MRKKLKDAYTALTIMAIILMAHALPEMAVTLIPTWLQVIFALVFILALAVFALWCLKQVIRLSREDY